MIQPEPKEKKKAGLLSKLPKLGRVSQLLLLIGIFLILFLPLVVIYQKQPAMQAGLQQEFSLLQKVLATPTTQNGDKGAVEAELKRVADETEAVRTIFPDPDKSPEIIDRLIQLAESNDIDITQAKVSTSKQKIGEAKDAVEWDKLTFEIGLKGQVAKFQNFMLALGKDDKLQTCVVREVTFTVAKKEGDKDTASLKIDVFCYKGS